MYKSTILEITSANSAGGVHIQRGPVLYVVIIPCGIDRFLQDNLNVYIDITRDIVQREHTTKSSRSGTFFLWDYLDKETTVFK